MSSASDGRYKDLQILIFLGAGPFTSEVFLGQVTPAKGVFNTSGVSEGRYCGRKATVLAPWPGFPTTLHTPIMVLMMVLYNRPSLSSGLF